MMISFEIIIVPFSIYPLKKLHVYTYLQLHKYNFSYYIVFIQIFFTELFIYTNAYYHHAGRWLTLGEHYKLTILAAGNALLHLHFSIVSMAHFQM